MNGTLGLRCDYENFPFSQQQIKTSGKKDETLQEYLTWITWSVLLESDNYV